MNVTTKKSFDWKLIGLLGLTAVIPATLAVFRLYGPVGEVTVWTILAAGVWIPLAVRKGIENRLATMSMVGFVSGIVTGIIQTALAGAIFERDPELAKSYGGVVTMAVRAELFFLDVMIGITWGLVVGAVWAGVSALRRRMAAKPKTEPA